MGEFNEMQNVKRRLFAMRNGIVADALRQGGSPFRIIFGLVLPQISEIAQSIGHNTDLAEQLWQNRTTRESMLLAPMLVNPAGFSHSEAVKWCLDCPSTEIADNLVHKLLRFMPDSYGVAIKLAESDDDMSRYAAMRLLWHHLQTHSVETERLAKTELSRNCKLTRQPAAQIIEEIEFLNSLEGQ